MHDQSLFPQFSPCACRCSVLSHCHDLGHCFQHCYCSVLLLLSLHSEQRMGSRHGFFPYGRLCDSTCTHCNVSNINLTSFLSPCITPFLFSRILFIFRNKPGAVYKQPPLPDHARKDRTSSIDSSASRGLNLSSSSHGSEMTPEKDAGTTHVYYNSDI